MNTPSGSEQLLSLAWMLQSIAHFSREDALVAVDGLCGIDAQKRDSLLSDWSWFVGEGSGIARQQIEDGWNARFARQTNCWLDEDAWHQPLWRLPLPERKMVFAANLDYLLSIRGRGSVAALAKYLGRSTTTASKWGRWQAEGRKVRVPPATAMPRILDFFGLKAACDLCEEPLFLGRAELEDELVRIEGEHYLATLRGDFLKQAVARIREESLRQIDSLAKRRC